MNITTTQAKVAAFNSLLNNGLVTGSLDSFEIEWGRIWLKIINGSLWAYAQYRDHNYSCIL